jgi:AcrR family transcriptional regulator
VTAAQTEAATRHRARRGEGDKLRREILGVAEKLLVETGDESNVSIRSIADAVGCTPPAIYLHWSDKDELFHEVCSGRFKEFDDWIEEAGAQSDDPLESLRLRGKAYVRFGLEHPEVYRLLMLTKAEGNIDEPGHEAGRACFTHLVEAVDRCVKSGAFTDVDPLVASLALWAGVHGLTSLLITFPDFDWRDVDALIDFTLDVAIEGLLAS